VRSAPRSALAIATIVATVVLTAGCGANERPALPRGSEPVRLDPSDFVSDVQNPYWPLERGNRWVYRESDAEGGEQKVEVTVADEAKVILGVDAIVVHDLVTEEGRPVEDTFDWYAVDRFGNLWYLGEDTKELENGKVVSTEGSWEAGVDGAEPGVALPGDPLVGLSYRQEYYEGEAEDAAKVLSLTESVDVPYGSFDGVLETKDFTPLQPDLVEHKFYAKGVGPILAVTVSGGSDREELVSFDQG
jgi:hypothetical protein